MLNEPFGTCFRGLVHEKAGSGISVKGAWNNFEGLPANFSNRLDQVLRRAGSPPESYLTLCLHTERSHLIGLTREAETTQ
eukprot:6295519-Amphidinium_carterae.1